jgi:glyoxylase-like metal-dependent hydrolase (beta-lactamase superfamily II)
MSRTDARVAGEPVEVADGVYRLGSRLVNWYLVDDGDGLTVVDAGLPDHWDAFVAALASLGHAPGDVDAVVLTHAHPDHAGVAERLRLAADAPVYLHPAEAALAASPGGPPPRGLVLNAWRPPVARYLLGSLREGAARVEPVRAFEPMADGDCLDVPGRPRIRYAPGHSPGQCAVVLAGGRVLLSGDVVGCRDLLRGRSTPPRPPDAAVNDDHALAVASARSLADLGEVTVLPGHGEPWTGDLATALGVLEAA